MFETLLESYGEAAVSLSGGLFVGALFGAAAQRSGFCFRSAVIETHRKGPGERFGLWLAALATAVLAVQTTSLAGLIDLSVVRSLNGAASLSGAAIGGALFGAGMVLARGCVSRLLVLSASGNLRAVATTAIFVLVALATMRGPLAEARQALASILPVSGADRLNALRFLGLSPLVGVALGGALLAAAFVIGLHRGLSVGNAVLGVAVGALVAAAYAFTSALNGASFDPQPVVGLTFVAPYANGLAMGLGQIAPRPDFAIAVIPGVAIGAFVSALLSGGLKVETFASARAIPRYAVGGALMGFGGVLATGCSFGNGISGVAVASTTALIALAGMWIGAAATDAVIDRERRPAPAFVPAE